MRGVIALSFIFAFAMKTFGKDVDIGGYLDWLDKQEIPTKTNKYVPPVIIVTQEELDKVLNKD